MRNFCFQEGDRVRVDGMVHVVDWATNTGFDTYCVVADNYQPAWLIAHHADGPHDREHYEQAAQQMQVAPDVPTTCLVCLGKVLHAWLATYEWS